jgi:hypothetical protein
VVLLDCSINFQKLHIQCDVLGRGKLLRRRAFRFMDCNIHLTDQRGFVGIVGGFVLYIENLVE